MKPKTVCCVRARGRSAAPSSLIDVCSETLHNEVILTQTGLTVEYTCTIVERCLSFELALFMTVDLMEVFQVGRIIETTVD